MNPIIKSWRAVIAAFAIAISPILAGAGFVVSPVITHAQTVTGAIGITSQPNTGIQSQGGYFGIGGNRIQSQFPFGTVSSLAGTTTTFLGISVSSATEAQVSTPSVATATVTGMQVSLTTAPTTGTTTITLMSGAVATTITCNIVGAATTCSDFAHTAALIPGTLLDVKIVTGTGATATVGAWVTILETLQNA